MLTLAIILGAGGLVVAGSRLPAVRLSSVKKFLPSKTLRGSPSDLNPSMIALNMILAEIIQDPSSVSTLSSNTLRAKIRSNKQGGSITIEIFDMNYFRGSSGSIQVRILQEKEDTIRFTLKCSSKDATHVKKIIQDIDSLIVSSRKQKEREDLDRKALALVEELSPHSTPTPDPQTI